MARRRRNNNNNNSRVVLNKETVEAACKALITRVEKATEEPNMTMKEKNATRYTRRGLVTIDNTEYYFSANRFGIPVVFGATSVEMAFELTKALDNKMSAHGKQQAYFKSSVESLYNAPNVYTDEIADGILIIKDNDRYFGYMPGKAGCRAVCYRKGGKHYSCSVKSLIKDLDRPGKQSFRQMASQGQDIKRMIDDFNRIIYILDSRTSPNPDNKPPRARRSRRAPESENNNVETNNAETKQPEQQPVQQQEEQRPRRPRRNRTVNLNNDDKVVEVLNKLFEICLHNDTYDSLLEQLTSQKAAAWVNNINECGPSVSEVASNFRDDLSVLFSDPQYSSLSNAVLNCM